MKNKVCVSAVEAGSIAQELDIKVGDQLLTVNSREVIDLLDYMDLMLNEKLTLEFMREDGEVYECEVEKEIYEDIGLTFTPELMSPQRACKNKCMFCFIDQAAPNMRDTIYFKDDDWRLSYLYGNYVTLTNVTDEEIDRICERHYSPLYVSVHTMNPELRVKMMKNPNAAKIKQQLDKFLEYGIMVNCQIVLCPGINDGKELEYSLNELYKYSEIIDSVAVVPVGLTKHREGLAELRCYTKEEAFDVLVQVHKMQKKALKELDRRFVFASDEFYIKAEHDLPDFEALEDFSQLENGVGLITSFADEFAGALDSLNVTRSPYKRVLVVTGESAYEFMSEIAAVAGEVLNTEVDVVKAENNFFGTTVTVAGLLVGSDVKAAIDKAGDCDVVLLPSVMFRSGTEVFLDDMTKTQLEEETGKKIVIIPVDGECFLQAVAGKKKF